MEPELIYGQSSGLEIISHEIILVIFILWKSSHSLACYQDDTLVIKKKIKIQKSFNCCSKNM